MFGMKGVLVALVALLFLPAVDPPSAHADQETARADEEAALVEAEWLSVRAVRLYHSGRLNEALTFARRALAIREELLGANHLGVAVSLSNLAAILNARGHSFEAEPLYRRALAIREKALGREHPRVAESLNNLGGVYVSIGYFSEAEPLYRRALDTLEDALGREHPDFARILGNYATLLRRRGNFGGAEPLYRRAVDILEEALGPGDPDVARSIGNLAALLQAKGDYDAAEPLYRRALDIFEEAYGPEHPDVATTLNKLAELFQAKGNYDAAELLNRRALDIFEEVYGSEHPAVAESLSAIGRVLRRRGEFEAAESLYRRALDMHKELLGPEHPRVATLYNDFANLLADKGEYRGAERLYRRALDTVEQAYGGEHPHVAVTLSNFAALLEENGDYTKAKILYRRALAIEDRHAVRILGTGSDRQTRAFVSSLVESTYNAVSFHVERTPRNEESLTLALRTLLRRKGIAAEMGADVLRVLSERAEPEDREAFESLRQSRSELAQRTVAGPPEGASLDDHRAALDQLESEVESLERELSARYAVLHQGREPVTIGSVRDALPTNAALVEYGVYRPSDAAADRGEQWGEPRYVAYVLPKSGEPRHADLGPASTIEEAVTAFRRALARPTHRVDEAARALDELVMEPVRPLLDGTRDVYVAPDGALHLIPFAALVGEEGRFLIERYRFTMLTSGRDLLRLRERVEPRSEPLIMGGPAYDEPGLGSGYGESRGWRSADFEDKEFSALPGAREEARAIGEMIEEARLLTGRRATEAAVKDAEGPRILHIATHGFFLADPEEPHAEQPRGFATRRGGLRSERLVPEDPMLRAGLAFAGANLRQGGDGEDGVLTALEASNLDLWGTQLVVLSACQTGVGEVETGEVVHGLRRALVVSGAETQVMSLWDVHDEATAALMQDYYRRVLNGGGRIDALREAQVAMLNDSETQHPHYWAAFVAAGDGRSLSYEAPPTVRKADAPSPDEVMQIERTAGCAGCQTTGARTGPVLFLIVAIAATILRSLRLWCGFIGTRSCSQGGRLGKES